MPELDEATEQEVRRSDIDSLRQTIARTANFSDFRPDPPRDLHGAKYGWLTWIPPQDDNFTHYRLRIDRDHGEPDYEIPSGQRSLQIFRGRTFFFTTYNKSNGYESSKVVLVYDAEADFREFAAQIAGDVMVTMNYTLDSSPYPIPLNPAPSPCFGLAVYLTQDATGGRVPSWDASFKNAPTTGLTGTASTLSVIRFEYRKVAGDPAGDDAWYCTGYDTGLATV